MLVVASQRLLAVLRLTLAVLRLTFWIWLLHRRKCSPLSHIYHIYVLLTVAYAENFHVFLFSGIWWSFLFDVRCLWRHDLTSYSCFQTNVLAKFVGIICIFVYTHFLNLWVIELNVNYQRSRLGWRKMHSTPRHSSSQLQKCRAAR